MCSFVHTRYLCRILSEVLQCNFLFKDRCSLRLGYMVDFRPNPMPITVSGNLSIDFNGHLNGLLATALVLWISKSQSTEKRTCIIFKIENNYSRFGFKFTVVWNLFLLCLLSKWLLRLNKMDFVFFILLKKKNSLREKSFKVQFESNPRYEWKPPTKQCKGKTHVL